jgi:hypothetical protein
MGLFLRILAVPLLATLLAAGSAAAQIRINEIYANPPGATEDGLERVEIFNAGAAAVDVTGWAIEDLATIDNTTVRARLPEDFDTASMCPGGAVIQPGEFRVLKGQAAAAWINNGTETLYLCSNRVLPAAVVHQVSYTSTVEGSSYACIPNGSVNFEWRTPLTLCATNGGIGDVTPPATVADLAAQPGAYPGEVLLTWTAPGDDGAAGTASAYVIRWSYAALTAGNFGAAGDLDRWIVEPVPAAGGTAESLYVFGLNPDSTYHFALLAQDDVPNTGGVSNDASSAPAPGTLPAAGLGDSIYFGNLHSHTGYSDGVQTPADAFTFARNTAPTPLDFLAVTDHNHVSAGMSYPNYALGLSQAAAANDDGDFVAIYGQEWGLAANGHVILLDAPGLFGWDAGHYDWFVAEGDYASLYTAYRAHPPASNPPVALFCHPALSDFDNLAVTADALEVVHLMCLVNGPAGSTSTTESDIGNTNFDGAFHEALRKGFRVSPTGDQDNHSANWGASTQSRTGVLMPALAKDGLMSALAARRCYATQDHNARVEFSADGHRMGDAFTRGAGVRIAVRVTDPDPADRVTEIELLRGITGVSTAVVVARNSGSGEFAWRETAAFPSGTEAHYYLRIHTADTQTIWTGPVYVTYDASSPVAVGGARPRAAGLALAVAPNPSNGVQSLRFSLPRAGHAELGVYDAAGRSVRRLADGTLAAGEHHAEWDGRTGTGEPAGPGLYFLRLASGGGAISRKVLRLK